MCQSQVTTKNQSKAYVTIKMKAEINEKFY